MRNVAIGGLVAVGVSLLLLLVTAGGEHGWKIALALLGLVLWVLGGLSRT
jgi:hypothetical protein